MKIVVSSVALLILTMLTPAVAGTFTMLSDDSKLAPDAGGWGAPRINNSGQVIMTQRRTNLVGGQPWLYDHGSLTGIPNTGSAYILYGSWDLNNNGSFVYVTEATAYLHIASITTGDRFVSSNKYYYAPDINDSDAVACVRYESSSYYVKTSGDLGASFSTVSGAWMDYYTSAINNAGQIAYKYGGYYAGDGTVYLYTPDAGTTSFQKAKSQSPLGLDDAGNVFYGGSNGWLYRNNTPLVQIADGNYSGGLSMSDHGQMVWTQWVDGRSDVWTFVNGTATNITQGLFGNTADALYPDINDNGDIVFMVTTGTFSSDVYLWAIPEPASLAFLAMGGMACLLRRHRH